MADFGEFEEELEGENLEEKEPQSIKRKIKVIEKELKNISNLKWVYTKQSLRFGVASWIFGVCAFVAAYREPSLILNVPLFLWRC